MSIIRKLEPTLTLQELEDILNNALINGIDDDTNNHIFVSLVSFRAGESADDKDFGDVAEFSQIPVATTDRVKIVGDVPHDADGDTGFFSSLQQKGLELLTYSDLFVEGRRIEAITCIVTPAEPASAEPAPVGPPPATPVATGPGAVASGPGKTPLISPNALKLILDFEGIDQAFLWPGGDSGISIGVGYDLGQIGDADFRNDWGAFLTAAQIQRLSAAIGRQGQAAKAMASQFRDITVTRPSSEAVFTGRDVPRIRAQSAKAFPGFGNLPVDAQGAIMSLVFNRGPAMGGDRRREMRAIRDAVSAYVPGTDVHPTLAEIAHQFQAMKRLWAGQGLDGLGRRRDAEAELALNA